MAKRDLIELIPLAIVAIIGLYSLLEVINTDYIFGARQHVGLTLVLVSIILFFVNRRSYKYIFGISLLLGLVSLIGFTTTILTMNFLGLPIQLIILPIIAIFAWIHKEEIKPIIRGLTGRSEEQITSESKLKVKGFKRRFEKLSNEELDKRLNEKLVPEAIEALQWIKKERSEKDKKPYSARYRIGETFFITNRGIVLAGEILEGEISIGDFIKFEVNGKYRLRKIKGIEGISRAHPDKPNTGLLIECIDPSEIEELKAWKPKKVLAEIGER